MSSNCGIIAGGQPSLVSRAHAYTYLSVDHARHARPGPVGQSEATRPVFRLDQSVPADSTGASRFRRVRIGREAARQGV